MVVNCNFHSFGCTIDVVWRFGSAVSEVIHFEYNSGLLFYYEIIDFEILSTYNGSTKRHNVYVYK